MNQVYMMGTVSCEPRLVQKEGNPAHLVFTLRVSHRSKAGEKKEYYPINAWNQAAEWGARELRQGRRILVDGYLTQTQRPEGLQVQVTANRFYLQAMAELPEEAPQAAAGQGEGAQGDKAKEPEAGAR